MTNVFSVELSHYITKRKFKKKNAAVIDRLRFFSTCKAKSIENIITKKKKTKKFLELNYILYTQVLIVYR